MKTNDITSRLGQFAWRQITPSTIPLPVIFRNNNREEYLCVQLINIHLLSKFSSETISYCMKQSPIHYFSLTQAEAKLFHYINQFHSNGYLANYKKLDYSRLDSAYITPFIPFVHFYQFISSTSQSIQNNAFCFSSKYNKTILDKEKEDINNKYLLDKMISSSSPNVCKSKNSYCQSIFFHGKEIITYCTTSSTDLNQTILCLSIKDILLTYFPWTTSEQFIQLCRLKEIIRYKPDKSTNSDLSLRLINIHQLEQYWNFFTHQLSPNPQLTSSPTSQFNQNTNEKSSITDSPSLTIDTHQNLSISSSNIIEQSFENISENVSSSILSQHENSSYQIDSIQSIENDQIYLQTKNLLNQLIEIIEEQQINSSGNQIGNKQNQLITNSSESKQEEIILSTTLNKNIKRKRRRSQKCLFTSKRQKRKQSNDQSQSWIQKYSIKPISILLHRVSLPIH